MTALKVRDRDDLLTVMRQAREATGRTHLEMDEIVGLGSGHYGKLERMGASWGKQGFKLTPSIVNCLDALNLELIIAPKGELSAEPVARDVRLPPPTNVLAFPSMPMSERPGQVAAFRAKLAQRAAERAEKAQKKGRRARAQRPEFGGATCQGVGA